MTTSFMENWRPQGMPLSTLCSCAGIACPPHLAQLMIKGITADSRRVKEGWLFVALKGYTKNGEDFILDACQRGAILCVAEESPKTDPLVPVLLVSNAREALAYLCDAWYDHPSEKFRMVGVTGTNGKTSVCAMLAHILKSAGVPCGVIGTLGCISPQGHKLAVTPSVSTAHMTTPDPEELYLALALMAQEVESQEAVVVMEVTSHALALCKTDPINFEVGIFTNLTPEHLDFHGDMENYFNAKAKLFSATRKAVINAQDAYGKRLVSLPSSVVER